MLNLPLSLSPPDSVKSDTAERKRNDINAAIAILTRVIANDKGKTFAVLLKVCKSTSLYLHWTFYMGLRAPIVVVFVVACFRSQAVGVWFGCRHMIEQQGPVWMRRGADNSKKQSKAVQGLSVC